MVDHLSQPVGEGTIDLRLTLEGNGSSKGQIDLGLDDPIAREVAPFRRIVTRRQKRIVTHVDAAPTSVLQGYRFDRGCRDGVGCADVNRTLRCRKFAFPCEELRLATGEHRAVGAGDQDRVWCQKRSDGARSAFASAALNAARRMRIARSMVTVICLP